MADLEFDVYDIKMLPVKKSDIPPPRKKFSFYRTLLEKFLLSGAEAVKLFGFPQDKYEIIYNALACAAKKVDKIEVRARKPEIYLILKEATQCQT